MVANELTTGQILADFPQLTTGLELTVKRPAAEQSVYTDVAGDSRRPPMHQSDQGGPLGPVAEPTS